MRKNKKGFTLIELLAVIVILAIIMVIAVPQILNVINDSRKSAWDNSIKLIANSMQTNSTLFDPSTGGQKFDIGTKFCTTVSSGTTKTDVKGNGYFAQIVDLGDVDHIYCNSKTPVTGGYDTVFEVGGKNQFSGKTATIKCETRGTESKCYKQ